MTLKTWLIEDIREIIDSFKEKRSKSENIMKKDLLLHERVYLIMSIMLPHLFPIPKDKPFPRFMALDLLLSLFLIVAIFTSCYLVFYSEDSIGNQGGEINEILNESYGIGSVKDLILCRTILDNQKGDEFYVDIGD